MLLGYDPLLTTSLEESPRSPLPERRGGEPVLVYPLEKRQTDPING